MFVFIFSAAVAAQAASAAAGFDDQIVLPGIWSLSPIGLFIGGLAIFYLGLSTSRLYTKAQHGEIVAGLREQIELHKGNAERWERVATETISQNGELLASSTLTKDFFGKVDVKLKGEA